MNPHSTQDMHIIAVFIMDPIQVDLVYVQAFWS